MLTSGTTVPDGEIIETEVCVIGAGVAGLSVATELTRLGHDVVVLERGDRHRSVVPRTFDDVGLRYSANETRRIGVGGSVNAWDVGTPLGGGFGRIRELDEEDFHHRPWIANSGWPISKGELVGHYADARRRFGLDPSRTDADWDASMAGHPVSESPSLRASTFTLANPANLTAVAARELTNHPEALLLTDSAAASLVTSERAVSEVRVVTAGPSFRVRAAWYVVAAGALETARLLLASEGTGADRLRSNDVVGRYFMEHPHFASGLLDPEASGSLITDARVASIGAVDGIPVQVTIGLRDELVAEQQLPRVTYLIQLVRDTAAVRRLGHSDAVDLAIRRASERTRSLRSGQTVVAEDLAGLLRDAPLALGYIVSDVWRRAASSIGLRRYRHPRLVKLYAMAEQIPNPASRVLLGDAVDEFGLRRGVLDWRLTDDDVAGFRASQGLLSSELEAMGCGRTVARFRRSHHLLPGLVGGAHHMGTARMAHSPSRGVVDRDCVVHDMANLAVAGSAVFPTGGFANPTLTIVALALRLAGHLARRLEADRI